MPIQKIPLLEFLALAGSQPVLDVRSPGEFSQAHIPGAISLPLFTDEERKVVGTAYKQQGKQKAIKAGLDYFGPKMREIVETVEKIIEEHSKGKTGTDATILVHCWRGGMRSMAIAWLLDLYGFTVFTLAGGYKAYRNWVLKQFEKDYDLKILGGFTGSGKTNILKQLAEKGENIIDLEGLAKHKGSAFGGLAEEIQPRQEMFENLLAKELAMLNGKNCWLEDESQRIGVLNIPNGLWKKMRQKSLFFIDIPFEERLKNVLNEYGSYKKEALSDAVARIQKKLGPQETKTALGLLSEDNYAAAFEILLAYYDKMYNRSLQGRENLIGLLNKIDCIAVDTISNTAKLLSCATVNI